MSKRPSEALDRCREVIRELVSKYRTTNPRVFGSVLEGSDRAGSDLDLLVDPLPGVTLLDLGALQVNLEEILGVPVDVLTPNDLPKSYRADVLRRAVPV